MGNPDRRRVAICVVPLLFGILTATRAASHVRGVDFLTIFGAGILFGMGVMGLVQFLRTRSAANRTGF